MHFNASGARPNYGSLMLRATLEAIKNKKQANNGTAPSSAIKSVPSSINEGGQSPPTKIARIDDCPKVTQDEEEIRALLDELDRMDPPLKGLTPKGHLTEQESRESAIIAQQVTRNQVSFSDFDLDDIEVMPAIESQPSGVRGGLKSLGRSDKLFELPYPFTFAPTFSHQEYTRNMETITTSLNITTISTLASIETGTSTKTGKLLLTLIRIDQNDVDFEGTLADASGDITVTLHHDITRTFNVVLHYGMMLLISDATIFRLPSTGLPNPSHLIITPLNIDCIFCNVHPVS